MTRPTRRLFTVHKYHRMAEAGVLTEDDRVELLDGDIVEITPAGSRHAACVGRLNELLVRRGSGLSLVRIQSPILLGPRSEPQPDVALVNPKADY